MTLRPALDIRSRPRLSLPPEHSQDTVQQNGAQDCTRVTAAAKGLKQPESLYYCGLQARIAPFVLTAKQRTSKCTNFYMARKTEDGEGIEGRNSPVRLLCHVCVFQSILVVRVSILRLRRMFMDRQGIV